MLSTRALGALANAAFLAYAGTKGKFNMITPYDMEFGINLSDGLVSTFVYGLVSLVISHALHCRSALTYHRQERKE